MGNICSQDRVETVLVEEDVSMAVSSSRFTEKRVTVGEVAARDPARIETKASSTPLPLGESPHRQISSSRGTLVGTPKFIGSFGKLKGFLRKCLEESVIDNVSFEDLGKCLEEVAESGKSRHGTRHITVMSAPLFFDSSEQEVADGMGLMDMHVYKPSLRKKLSLNEGSFIIENEGVTEFSALLIDENFNCRTRGQIHLDVQAVVYGFTTPYNLVGRYGIDTAVLERWVSALAQKYEHNPYHNWMHAFDVFQFLHMCLARGGAGEYFNFQDILAILCSAIGHDVAHGGTTNAFLVNTSARLAITYNDRSPLENMHAAVCFETLKVDGCNFMKPMKQKDFTVFRGKVIENILATDMYHHFELVDKFTERVSHATDEPFVKNTKTCRDVQKETKEDRHLLMQAFTHMGDLCHCTRSWDVHKTLVTCLEEEFFCQGDKEKAADLPISPMMDRSKDSAATGQTFFLDKLVTPLLEPFSTFVNETLSEIFHKNLINNRDKWAELVKRHGKLPAKELVPLERLSEAFDEE